MMTSVQRIEKCDWKAIRNQLDELGYALTSTLLTADECHKLVGLYAEKGVFRSRVVMARHNFGQGEYQYFANPLPSLVAQLREHFYPSLAEIANGWSQRLNQPERFPPTLDEFL